MARKKMPMVAWFDPRQLADTAIRVVVSKVFGQFADRREAFAAANPIDDETLDDRCDYRTGHAQGKDFWFDYVADIGDGWNPTYAIARLLAEAELRPAGADAPLPRGRLLIMGGDEVYPTAKREEYENRLLHPYDHAYRPDGDEARQRWPAEKRPDLFVLPGNHDWYDGLKIFFHFFCRRTIKRSGEAEVDRDGRLFGGRRTNQTRSYFALKLPGNWWLWGTDSQLDGYIDQPQIDFFQYVAEHWMEEGSRLILCTGTPDWQYVHEKGPESFASHSYLERLATDVVRRRHQLKLVLSGDSHHYVRYQEEGRDYITCGGGGAFLHPTHKLRNQDFSFKYPPPGIPFPEPTGGYHPSVPYNREEKCFRRHFRIATKQDGKTESLFPDREASARLARGNAFFAFRNWELTATLAGLYLFFIWLLDFNGRVSGKGMLIKLLGDGGYWQAVESFWWLVLYSPWTIQLCLLSVAGYYYFTDAKGFKKVAIAIVHSALQAALVTLVAVAVIRWLAAPGIGMAGVIGLMALAATAAGFASATLVGLYLWAVLACFGIQWGHFSSLKVQDYKSFLRLRIDGEGRLHVYPIGLPTVPNDRRWPTDELPPGAVLIEKILPIS